MINVARQSWHEGARLSVIDRGKSGAGLVPGLHLISAKHFAAEAGTNFFLNRCRNYLLRRIAEEIKVMINPTGNGSMKVNAALINGLSYIVLKFFIS